MKSRIYFALCLCIHANFLFAQDANTASLSRSIEQHPDSLALHKAYIKHFIRKQ